MKIDGHYDSRADIAWLRFENYPAASVIAERTEFGLREIDPADQRIVGFEYWHASQALPPELLAMLPSPPLSVTR